MSGFISAASGLHGAAIQPEDRRGVDSYDGDVASGFVLAEYPVGLIDDGVPIYSWRTQWWPGAACISGGDSWVVKGWWSSPWVSSGANGRLGFVGVTRDSYGSPLGAVTVRCFRTSSNELVSQVTSDANGFYTATTPYSDGHYLVVHKSGTVAGASVDTLIPG